MHFCYDMANYNDKQSVQTANGSRLGPVYCRTLILTLDMQFHVTMLESAIPQSTHAMPSLSCHLALKIFVCVASPN